MTVITNIKLRSPYNTVPSDNVQQVASGLPITTTLGTYQALSLASIVADKSMTGSYRLSVSGKINEYSDLMFYYVKNGNKIDTSCPEGWWCGTPPYYFTYTRDFVDNINVGDVFEVYAYNRYIGTNSVVINDFTLSYSDVQKPILYILASGCKDYIISGDTSKITIHVFDDTGIAVSGANIDLSTTGGTLDPINGTTDSNGDFTSTFTPPTVTQIDTISVIASNPGYIGGSGSIQITVISTLLTSLEITPSNPSIAVGQSLGLTAIPRDQLGAIITSGVTITWSSGDDTKVTVNPSGITTTIFGNDITITPIIITATATDGINTATTTTTVTVTPLAMAGPSTGGMILLAGLLFGLLLRKKCEDYKNKEDCEKKDCQWKTDKCIPFTKEQKLLIDALRREGAKGIPSCKDGECRIGEWLAEYRKGKKPIIIDHPKEG